MNRTEMKWLTKDACCNPRISFNEVYDVFINKKNAQNYFKEITKCVLGHRLLKYMTLSSPIIVNILSKECLGDKTQKIRQLSKF